LDIVDGKYRRVTSRAYDDTIVEKFSKAALERDGRADRIEAEIWREETSYTPVLAKKGQRNVYDHTDDIPKDVKPLYHHQPFQSREYLQWQRDKAARPLWKRLLRWAAIGTVLSGFTATVEFTRIWLQQPQEVAAMRVKILESAYGKVMELGAGHGLNIGSYPYPVHEVVMVDQSQQLLDKLHYRIPKTAYPRYSTCQDRAERLESFKDGEFDCVIDMFGLCHYRDPVLALRQMQRVVKPTGMILLLEHGRSPYPPVNWILDYFADRHTAHTHGCLWNLPLRDYFKEARLVVREMEQHHYGTTYYVVAHPEVLDEEAMKYVPKRDELLVR
jgi:methyltransferase OMS1